MPNWKKLIVSGSDASLNSLNVNTSVVADSFTGSLNISDSDTLGIGSQTFFPQGTNGFSVNEDFDPSNSSTQTAYHFTSGQGRETVAFTLARTGQFTDGFGIYGTSADNTLVMFGEQNNTSFEWRRGVGIRPLDLDGGTLLASLSPAGEFNVIGGITGSSFTGSFVGDGSGLTNVNANISEVATVSDTFTSTTSKSVNHSFGTKDVIVTVYNDSDQQIIPATVTTTDINNVTVTFDNATTGRIVIAKGGHIVSGSIVNIGEVATVEDTFTSVTSKTVTHTFGTKNVFVTVYNSSDDQIIPARVNTPTTSSVTVEFDSATSGRIVIGKAGHIVTGSSAAQWDSILNKPTGLISQSSQVDYNSVANTPSGLLSSSVQVDYTLISNVPSGIVSGSSQVDYTLLQNIPANIFSGSFNDVDSNPFTLGTGAVTASGHIVPDTNETYDLGSTSLRWRDLYLSGSTIYLGETKVSRDSSGNLEVRDSQTNNLKTLRVDQLEIGSGATARKIKVNNGRVEFTDNSDSILDAGSAAPPGTLSGSAQIDLTQTTNYVSGIKSRLDAELVVSSSAQVVSLVEGQNLILNNLTVNGTQTTIDSTNLDIGDSIITLNGGGATFGGISVKDSTAPGTVSGSLLWDGLNNYWIAGLSGSETRVAHNGMAPEFSGLTVDTDTLYVDSSNNRVGIGTTSPAEDLHISATNAALRIDNDGAEELTIIAGFSTFGNYFQNYNRSGGTYEKETHRATEYIWNGGGGQEFVRINTSGNVGIGTSTVKGKLHSSQGDSGQAAANVYANGLIVEDNTSNGISILTPSTAIGSIFFGDEADNFIGGFRYDHTDNSLATYVNNTERLRIDSSGRVGIGTSTFGSFDKVRITGTNATANDLVLATPNTAQSRIFFSDTDAEGVGELGYDHASNAMRIVTNGSERMRIDSSGNVGIGTTSPSSYSGYTTLTLNNNTNGGVLTFSNNSNPVGIVYNNSNDFVVGAEKTGANLIFRTNSTGTPAERMRIDSSGNVGIGTSSPTRQLEVSKAGTAYIRAADTSNSVNLDMLAASSGGWIGTQTNHDLLFQTNNTERARIDTSGNLIPAANGTQDLGSSTKRWNTLYTSDLSLSNGIGDYTIVEGEEDLFLYNNKSGKTFKFALIEVDPSQVPAKRD